MEKIELRKQFEIIREKTKKEIWAHDNYKCQYCGKNVITQEDIFNLSSQEHWTYEEYEMATYRTAKDRATLDHIIPLSRGGTNVRRNLITACQSCNSKKGTKVWKK